MAQPPSHYAALRVSEAASAAEIRAAYRALVLEVHPDKADHDAERFLRIQQAYETLRDAGQRADYDAARRSVAPSAAQSACHGAVPLAEWDEVCGGDELFYACRCGGEFVVPRADAQPGAAVFCSACSLHVVVE